jgi:hypothetical protein
MSSLALITLVTFCVICSCHKKQEAEWLQNGCLRKEACREHLDYINKGLLSQPNQGAKLALAHCDSSLIAKIY